MVRPPYGRFPAAAALALAWLLHPIAAFGAEDPIVLLDFWSPTCGPCMQMKPTVESLVRARYPIRQVNVSQEPDLARQFSVTGIPCFVMLVDGHEVDRVVGATSSERLQQMFTRAKEVVETNRRVRNSSPDAALSPQAADDQSGWSESEAPPSSAPARTSDAAPPASIAAVNATDAAALPQQLNNRLLSSSVRLTVEDAKGRSHGTATVIDARSGEALLITCGHLFRETKGQMPVSVELFEASPDGVGVVERLEGQVLSYDLDRDVAFVRIRPTHPVCVAAVAPQSTQIAKGDLAASVGCSNGQDPTVQPTRITCLDRYQGPPNIETSGAPVQGRSGGGLFNEHGQLVGVCFAADYEGNRGLYAGLQSIHEELDRLGLNDIYAKAAGSAIADHTKNSFEPLAAGPIVRGQELPATAPQTADTAATQPAGTSTVAPQTNGNPAPENLSETDHAALEEILTRATKHNVVVIVQPETPGGEVEVITLDHVSDEFVQALAKHQKTSATRSAFKPLQSLQSAQASFSAIESAGATNVHLGCPATPIHLAAVNGMVWYVAVIAVVNLALGYGLATLLGRNANRAAVAGSDAEGGEF